MLITTKTIYEYLSAFSYVKLDIPIQEDLHTYLVTPLVLLLMIIFDRP